MGSSIKQILLGLLLCSGFSAEASVALTQIDVKPDATQTHIELSLNGSTPYKIFTLDSPARLVIDFENTLLATDLKQISFSNTPIVDIRSGSLRNGKLRIVLDLQHALQLHTSETKDKAGDMQHLVLDLNNADSVNKRIAKIDEPDPILKAANEEATPVNVESAEVQTNTVTRTLQKIVKVLPKPDKTRDIVVVIDPGHGGKDPGAIGAHGTHEKDVVLAISQALQKALNAEPGVKAVLTRKGDYYIGLRDRLNIARKYRADMFVAVHADAYRNPESQGSSVFALSARGASSEAARWLAEKENYSELGGVSLQDKTDVLRSVLIDLSQNYTITASLQIGGAVLSELGKFTRLHHDQVEQARFVVLKSPDIPSILVETGFLSNPQEENRLTDDEFQAQIAQAITQGVNQYFKRNPPPGTLFALQRSLDKEGIELAQHAS